MSYTREQRAANAAKAANEAAQAAQAETREPTVPETADGEVRTVKTRNPKWEAMDEIAAASDKRQGLAPEQTETTDETPTPDQPVPKPTPPPAPPPSSQPESTPEPVETVAAPPEPIKTVKQTVDGKDYDVPAVEIEEAGGERLWRIERAAKNRLEKNNEVLAETRRLQAALLQQAQQFAASQPQKPQANEAQLLSMLRAGTDEEAAQAWQELQARNRVDPAAIENRATFRMNQKQAADQFRKEFSDIATNPHLYKLATVMEQERLPAALQQLGITTAADPRLPLFDFGTFFRQIGNEIRGALPRPSQPPATEAQPPAAGTTTSTPSQPSEKEARKASIVTLPTAAAARAEAPAEEKPQSREQVLAEMAKSRGKLAPGA